MTFADKDNKKHLADQMIAKHIVNELRQNSMINSVAIDVKIENGTVTILHST